MKILFLLALISFHTLAADVPASWMPFKKKLVLKATAETIEIDKRGFDGNLPQLIGIMTTNPEKFAVMKTTMVNFVKSTTPKLKFLSDLSTKDLCLALNSQKYTGMLHYQNDKRELSELMIGFEASKSYAQKLEKKIERSLELFNCSQLTFLKYLNFDSYKTELALYKLLGRKLSGLKAGKRLTPGEFYRNVEESYIFEFWHNQEVAAGISKDLSLGRSNALPGITVAHKELAKKAFNPGEFKDWMMKTIQFEIMESKKLKAGQDARIAGPFPKGVPTFDEVRPIAMEVKNIRNNATALEKYFGNHENVLGKLMIPLSGRATVKGGKVSSRSFEEWNKLLSDFSWSN